MNRLIEPDWLGRTLPRQVFAALELSLFAIALRWALSAWLGEQHELLPGYLAVAGATWLGTWRAGLIATAFSVVALNSPMFQLSPSADPGLQGEASMFTFLVVSTLLVWLTHLAFGRMHAVGDEVTRLDAADHRKSHFLALIAHELRNPLSAVGSAAALVRSGRLDTSSLQEAWDIIDRQTGHMKRLVSDLLDVARLEQAKIALECEPTCIATIVAQAVSDASSYLGARGQSVVVHDSAEGAQAFIDPLRIGQVLGNLVHNASKFSPAGAAITIRLARADDRLTLSVRDSGPGIPRAHIAAIFEPFVQLTPLASRPQGLGLGLALCKRLAEMHGGSIAAHSDGPGRGAEFVVTLPCVPSTATRTVSENVAEAAPRSTAGDPVHMDAETGAPPSRQAQGLRVLVVDDNRDAAESLALLLGMQGHESSTAADGKSALSKVAQDRPDFVFLDIGLPDMSGHEVAQRLRQNVRGHQPVLVALTGWGSEEDAHLSRQNGFDAHLVKPATLEQIEQALLTKAQPRNGRGHLRLAGGRLGITAVR